MTRKTILPAILGASLLTMMVGNTGLAADVPNKTATKPITIDLNGNKLNTATAPVIINGTTLIPMRDLFEAQGATLSWYPSFKTVSAVKGTTTLTYRIGNQTAQLDDQTINLTIPGMISHGYTLLPLRIMSEALGSQIDWDATTHTILVTTPPVFPQAPQTPEPPHPSTLPIPVMQYETSVLNGANLRSQPDSSNANNVLESLPVGSKLHVLRVVDAQWLQVQSKDGQTGYISAKPEYTDYKSAELADLQGDALIATGKKYLGIPYEFGASSDQIKTFDCSSFVKRVFHDTLSIDLPRVSYDQAKAGQAVDISQLRKGDLLFFSARGLDIGHVGIYAGNNEILHTYSKEQGVHIETFSDKWRKRFVTARRVF